ncbi:hypothetical protein ACE198_02330 [Neobacillus sp. KR4-4]|uniref:hypothetical protein n=1 Tax=Neobacillus sp. KR4-4 TaxID=3344872 RepID=UPI0035CA4231
METKKRDLKEKVEKSNNSSMAQNLEEIKKLGKEMEEEKTGTELKKEEKQTPDP